MLIEKFHIQTHFMWTTTLLWRKKIKPKSLNNSETVHSYICIAAFHLGMIEEPCGWHDIGAEPEDGEWWTHLEDGRMNPDVHDWSKMLAGQLSSN